MIINYFETTLFQAHYDSNLSQMIIYDMLDKGEEIKVLLVSREENGIKSDLHYHVLFSSILDIETLQQMLLDRQIYIRSIRDFDSSIKYFTKDGKFRLFNGFVINSNSKINMVDLIEDINNGYYYHDLVAKYGVSVLKYSNGIIKLIESINGRL